MTGKRQLCGFSIDVDSVQSHLRGYGVTDVEEKDQHLHLAIPRSIDLFSRYGVKATYFLIAEEAKRAPQIIRQIADSGHEVACHSMTHLLPFTPSEFEVSQSKKLLEELSGRPVLGFRAPSWDYRSELYTLLASSGYLYDASSFPSWMMLLYRNSVKKRAVGSAKNVGMPPLIDLFGLPVAHKLPPQNGASLVEIPVSASRIVRVPWYHTMNHLLPGPVFELVQRMTLVRPAPVQYVLHAVDFLGLEEDRIDSRLRMHPGMGERLDRKLARIEKVLKAVTARRDPATLGEIAAQVKW